MSREAQIKALLAQVAPLFLEIAESAQDAAAQLGETEWGRQNLVRTASVNQVAGTARWRMTGDSIVLRQSELPPSIELSTTDEEQNQGRYYLRATDVAVVLTIRRRPHDDNERPEVLQLQIQEVVELAPIDFGEEVVVYLSVPPAGRAPRFEVATRGKETITYVLADLVADQGTEMAPDAKLSTPPRAGATIRSTLDEGKEAEPDSAE